MTRSLLLQRNFGRYWFSALSATSGMWMWRVTSPVMIYQLTESPMMLGVLSVASYGPVLVFSFVGGVLADRFPRRWLISVAHSIIASLFFVLSGLSAAGRLTAHLIIAAAIVEGVVYAMTKPALQALVIELVAPEEVPRAVAVNTVHFSVSQLIGPSLATITLAVGGHALSLMVAGGLYAPVVVAMLFVHSHHLVGPSQSQERGMALVRGGFRALRIPSVARLLLAIAFGSIALEGAVRVLAPSFATDALGMNESAAGLIVSGQAVGSALAVIMVSRASRSRQAVRFAEFGYLFMAAAIVGYSFSPALFVALALAAAVGGAQTVGFSIATGIIHSAVPSDMRGRVMAFHAMALLGVRPLAGLIAGALASGIGTREASAFFCVFALGGAMVFRRILRAELSVVAVPRPVAVSPSAPRR